MPSRSEICRENENIILQEFIDDQCHTLSDSQDNTIESVGQLLIIYQDWRKQKVSLNVKIYLKTIRIRLFSELLSEKGFESERVGGRSFKTNLMSKLAYELYAEENKISTKKEEYKRLTLSEAERYEIKYKYKLSIKMYTKIKTSNCFQILRIGPSIDYEASRKLSVESYYSFRKETLIKPWVDKLMTEISAVDHTPTDKSLMILEGYKTRIVDKKEGSEKILYDLPFCLSDGIQRITSICKKIQTIENACDQKLKQKLLEYKPKLNENRLHIGIDSQILRLVDDGPTE